MIVAVDPGTEKSAVLAYAGGRVIHHSVLPNDEMLVRLLELWGGCAPHDVLAIEMVASYGMPVGKEVFETCVWVGRFIQLWNQAWAFVYRRDVKLHLCHSVRANDAAIRQALLDRFGPGKEKAVGTKKAPGPLYGLKGDEWAALAVAVTYEARAKSPPQTQTEIAAVRDAPAEDGFTYVSSEPPAKVDGLTLDELLNEET